MIYTLTANPAIDMNISCSGLEPNVVTRTRDAVYTPNGKGLNVSFTLKRRGISSTILGFFAGFTGRYVVEGAEALDCPVKPIWIEGITRVNVFLSDLARGNEYTLPNAGAPVCVADQERLYSLIDSCSDMRYLLISGSLPPGCNDDFLDKVISHAQAHNAEVVLDISSAHLAELLPLCPLLIKPNDDELRDIFGLEVRTDAEARASFAQLVKLGARNILCTLGDRGAYFYEASSNELWFAASVPVKPLQTACAGDATMASFFGEYFIKKAPVDEALRLAMATGANVVESAGLGDFSHVTDYMKKVKIRRIASL